MHLVVPHSAYTYPIYWSIDKVESSISGLDVRYTGHINVDGHLAALIDQW